MSERTIKSGGVAGVLAAALFILSAVTDTVAPIDVDYDSPNEYVYVAASTVAFLSVVVAVIGVRALAARTGRPARLATVAAWLVGVGYGAVGLLNIVNLLVGGRSLIMVRLGFAVVILVGSAILGVVVLRMHLLPWWCGALLVVAFPVGHFANALFASAENILLALLWGWVGVSLLVRATAPVEPAVGQSTRVS
jgi:hypothetical protein